MSSNEIPTKRQAPSSTYLQVPKFERYPRRALQNENPKLHASLVPNVIMP